MLQSFYFEFFGDIFDLYTEWYIDMKTELKSKKGSTPVLPLDKSVDDGFVPS